MAAEKQTTSEAPRKRSDWEWFWRFLAVVMVFVVGWVIWIAIQITPQTLVTQAAYEAAAKARTTRNAQGAITPAVRPAEKPPAEPAPKSKAPTAPPVNVEKLKLTDSISTPILQEPEKK